MHWYLLFPSFLKAWHLRKEQNFLDMIVGDIYKKEKKREGRRRKEEKGDRKIFVPCLETFELIFGSFIFIFAFCA